MSSTNNHLTPEERVWVEILLRDEQVGSLDGSKTRALLTEQRFPKRIIEAYLRSRSKEKSQIDFTTPTRGRDRWLVVFMITFIVIVISIVFLRSALGYVFVPSIAMLLLSSFKAFR